MNAGGAEYVVEVLRGEDRGVEARHSVTVRARIAGEDGAVVESPGEDAGPVTCFRSSCKPFQALPLVERGHAERFGFGSRELALACASHSGTEEHVAVVRGMLERVGCAEDELLCGFHPPSGLSPEHFARADEGRRSPVWNNCSGKHAAMLALAVAEGWPREGYVEHDHPVQRACVEATLAVCGVERSRVPVVTDGCSAANPVLPLAAMAHGWARFAAAREREGSTRERALGRLRRAMAEEPVLTAGAGRFCTELMRAAGPSLVVKTGAEGLLCAAVPAARAGVALKVRDGADRAKAPAMLAFLAERGWIAPETLEAMAAWRRRTLRNHRGLDVGEIRIASATGAATGAAAR